MQPLGEIYPEEPPHRFLIFDNASIFPPAVAYAIKSLEIEPKRTALRIPWQNGTADRFVGSIRRELRDHVLVFNEEHLRRLLRKYVDYDSSERVHTSIGDAPAGRPLEARPFADARIVSFPRVGGLHHRYRWREAAGSAGRCSPISTADGADES